MLLIADSGSTKTDWIFCQSGIGMVHSKTTVGFNPIVQSQDFISRHIKEAFQDTELNDKVTKVHYFGAGCSSEERKDILKNLLTPIFKNAQVEVDHDMNAAVIATCGDRPGFAAILGTGSNAVFFDGHDIVPPKGSLGLGYILGDEGSGAHIGKLVLRDFLYKRLPFSLQKHLEEVKHLDKSIVLQKVYKEPNANTFMASIAKEINGFRHLPYVQEILNEVFTDFFKFNIAIYDQYQSYPVNFIGSIAVNFEPELKRAAESFGIHVGKIIHKPIGQIVSYFLVKSQQ